MAVGNSVTVYPVSDGGVGAGDPSMVITADVEYYTDDSAASGMSSGGSKSADY